GRRGPPERGAECAAALGRPYGSRGGAAGGVLPRRGLPPGLLPGQPGAAVLPGGGFAEGGQVSQTVRGQNQGVSPSPPPAALSHRGERGEQDSACFLPPLPPLWGSGRGWGA